ncbi:MAG: diadenylate cyclase [Planctomycetaceae bacterium]|nr:diadenylate cyclase [Planctomycetaceae bacterium]
MPPSSASAKLVAPVVPPAVTPSSPLELPPGMKLHRFDSEFSSVIELGAKLCRQTEAGAMLLMLEGPTDWTELASRTEGLRLVIAADTSDELTGAEELGLATIVLSMQDSPVIEKLTQALLTGVAREILAPGAGVVVVYSGFEADTIDSISYIKLDDHLGRLTARDLRQLETSVPLETLKTVIDLGVEIGREGREGKPIGTMFVVGDTRKVLRHCQPAGYDPVKGHSRSERDLHDHRVREAVKEVAVLDGAFIVSPDGIVEKAAQIVDAPYKNLTLSKGLGARHWAGAAISKTTAAIAVVISQSSGTVRIFQNGEVMLRIEPLRQAMKWKDFEYEPPQAEVE